MNFEQNLNRNYPTVRFTVKSNDQVGTITFADYKAEKITGEHFKNIQFVDSYGNNMGFNGTVDKVLKVEEYINGWIVTFDSENAPKVEANSFAEAVLYMHTISEVAETLAGEPDAGHMKNWNITEEEWRENLSIALRVMKQHIEW